MCTCGPCKFMSTTCMQLPSEARGHLIPGNELAAWPESWGPDLSPLTEQWCFWLLNSLQPSSAGFCFGLLLSPLCLWGCALCLCGGVGPAAATKLRCHVLLSSWSLAALAWDPVALQEALPVFSAYVSFTPHICMVGKGKCWVISVLEYLRKESKMKPGKGGPGFLWLLSKPSAPPSYSIRWRTVIISLGPQHLYWFLGSYIFLSLLSFPDQTLENKETMLIPHLLKEPAVICQLKHSNCGQSLPSLLYWSMFS